MHTPTEKEGFASRLREAAAHATPPVLNASELARQFALRYKHGSVTPGAVRKWWLGLVIPTEEKLDVLSAWLKVPKNWLRYGESPKTRKGEAVYEASGADEILVLQRWRLLSASQKKLLLELMNELVD
jgi:hypothetical protein